ncbi:MAG: hypothetical protein ACFB15_30370 [Cyclobacteriaceae bacterium]
MNTNKRWAWLTMLLIGMLSLGTISCNEDDNDDNNNVTPAPDEPQETETAWMIGYRVGTPQGAVRYFEVHEEFPSQTNPSQAIEVGLASRVYSFGEHPFTYNENAGTMTKWSVDKSTLEISVAGIVSFASQGFSGLAGGPPIFLSETQAFVSNLREGVVLEWNPSIMEITTVHNVDPLPSLGDGYESGFYGEWNKYASSDGKVVMAVEHYAPDACCDEEFLAQPDGAIVAVFDPASGTIQYNQDDRLYSTHDDLLYDPVTDTYYAPPADGNSIASEYFGEELIENPFVLLRLNDDGSFDPNFALNLEDHVSIDYFSDADFIFDNKLVFTYIENVDYSTSFAERWNWFGTLPPDAIKTVAIDINTGEVLPFNGFNEFPFGWYLNSVDGVNYFDGTSSDGADNGILRQDGFDSFTTLTTNDNGDFRWVGKLWGD